MRSWPDASLFAEAIQNPRTAFPGDDFHDLIAATNRFGLPIVYSGNFASVFKLIRPQAPPVAIRCFLRDVGDRERRYRAIAAHLDKVSAKCITRFDYEPQGIVVNGSVYPIVVMDWIDGWTLDQYVQSDAASPSTYGSLAEQWCSLVAELEEAHIAHGDLQHGNVLVSRGELRLVDYDGMFVPPLNGLQAAERGHPAYQHPLRTERFFDERLDRFSTLVVYLSLAALAERPQLRARCTGENLLFTPSDFRRPETSDVFAQLLRCGAQVNSLSDQLKRACKADPEKAPRLIDLVGAPTRSKLPLWLRPEATLPDPVNVEVPLPRRAPRESRQPVVIEARAAQPAPPPQPSLAVQPRPSPPGVFAQFSGKEFIGCLGTWVVFMALIGLFRASPEVVALVIGLGVLLSLTQSRKRAGMVTAPIPRPWQPSLPLRGPAPTPSGAGSYVVASAIRNIYHRPFCEWATKMSRRNQIRFASTSAARSAGYRPCRVCRP